MFTGQKINIQKVLGLIPDDLLSRLAQDTKVDYCSKVLYGQRIFNLLLYGLLTTDRTSQRTLEDLFGSKLFKSLFSYDADMKVSRSSISTRLSTIDNQLFRIWVKAGSASANLQLALLSKGFAIQINKRSLPQGRLLLYFCAYQTKKGHPFRRPLNTYSMIN